MCGSSFCECGAVERGEVAAQNHAKTGRLSLLMHLLIRQCVTVQCFDKSKEADYFL